jgi:hypothetical protein
LRPSVPGQGTLGLALPLVHIAERGHGARRGQRAEVLRKAFELMTERAEQFTG